MASVELKTVPDIFPEEMKDYDGANQFWPSSLIPVYQTTHNGPHHTTCQSLVACLLLSVGSSARRTRAV